MTLIAIERPLRFWPSVIRQVYKDDVLLLARNHVAAPCALGTAVADTYLALRDNVAEDFVFYGLYEERPHKPVGLIGIEKGSNLLITFGLNVAYRSPAGVAELARLIRTLCDVDRPLISGVYSHNTPAAKFLLRMGFLKDPRPIASPITGRAGHIFTLYPA